jgi:hypothetical protein
MRRAKTQRGEERREDSTKYEVRSTKYDVPSTKYQVGRNDEWMIGSKDVGMMGSKDVGMLGWDGKRRQIGNKRESR